jgi:hypothetical protein
MSAGHASSERRAEHDFALLYARRLNDCCCKAVSRTPKEEESSGEGGQIAILASHRPRLALGAVDGDARAALDASAVAALQTADSVGTRVARALGACELAAPDSIVAR